MKTDKIIEIVQELNDSIYDDLIGMGNNPIYPEFMPQISYETSGYVEMITLNGIHLWDSENYTHYEDGQEEEFKNFIIGQITNIANTLNSLILWE